MAWLHGSGCVALALAVAGCGSFVQAETATDGDGGSSGTTGTTNATVGLPTSGGTGTGGAGPGTTPVTSNSDASGTDPTDPTDPSNTGPTESDSSDPTTSSTAGDSSGGTDPIESTSGTGDGTEETGQETTGPQPCVQDDMEPNDVVGDANDMGTQTCDAAPNTFMGTFDDDGDVDLFFYYGQWVCGNDNEPNHVLTVTGEAQVCWFPLCDFGVEQVNCLSGTDVTSGDGFAGCCSTDEVVGDINCLNTGDETATGVVIVSPVSKELVCVNYEIAFSVEDN